MRRIARHRGAALAAVLLATATVAACAGSDAPAGTASSTTATTPAETTAPGATTGTSDPGDTSVDSTAPATTVPLATGMVGFDRAVEGLTTPVDIAFRDGDAAIYVAQQDGRVVRLLDGAATGTVLDISGKVSTGNEQGLLGLAFHPVEPFAYVGYTDRDGDTVVAEFAVAEDGTFDAGAERTVFTVDQPYANHNGGELVFGADRYLYIGLGDGGSADDPLRAALDLTSYLGKILRIDPLADGDQGYRIPGDNPFVDVAGAFPEIWSYGLRNPWRFDFDRATGDLWIADVGQNAWEEVNLARAADGAGRGANFGWSAWEGTHRFNEDQSPDGALPPIWEYPHGDDGCSVSGGTVYRGTAIPSLVGAYVVADYCSGKVWALQPSADGTAADVVPLGTVPNPSAVVAGPDGELWALAHGEGAMYRLTPA